MSPELLDSVLLQTDFPELQLHASGKVRDVYTVDGDQHLLFVATDRISAFDYVLATGIPHKGRVLTQISLFWFDFLADIVPNHLVTADVEQYPAADSQVCRPAPRTLDAGTPRRDVPGRVRRARLHLRLGLEGIQGHRQSLRHHAARGTEGIRQLPEPIFTPSTKATTGSRREHFLRGDVRVGWRRDGEPPSRSHAA